MREIVCGSCGGKVGIITKFGNGDELMTFVLRYEDNTDHRFVYWANKDLPFVRALEINDVGEIEFTDLIPAGEYQGIKNELFEKGEVEQ